MLAQASQRPGQGLRILQKSSLWVDPVEQMSSGTFWITLADWDLVLGEAGEAYDPQSPNYSAVVCSPVFLPHPNRQIYREAVGK